VVRGQRGSDCGGGRAGAAGPGETQRGKRTGSPRGRGEGAAVAGVYLLTILPVYQSPAVDAADSSRWQSRHLDSSRESSGRGG